MEREVPIMPSSNLKRAVYDEETKTLTCFLNGGVYRYSDVSQNTVQGLSDADSSGKYFFNFIRNNHSFEKIG